MVKRGLFALFALATLALLTSLAPSFAQQEGSAPNTTTSSTFATTLSEPTITITHTDSITGTHTETKPLNESGSGIEYFRTAGITISLSVTTTSVVLPFLPSPIPSLPLDEWWDQLKNLLPVIFIQLLNWLGNLLSRLWNIYKSHKEKTRPQPGVEFYPAYYLTTTS